MNAPRVSLLRAATKAPTASLGYSLASMGNAGGGLQKAHPSGRAGQTASRRCSACQGTDLGCALRLALRPARRGVGGIDGVARPGASGRFEPKKQRARVRAGA